MVGGISQAERLAERNDALVEQALAALRRLSRAPAAANADALAEELMAAWQRAPLSVGIAGDITARTQLVDALCGGTMFEPEGRVPGCAPVRIRRGTTTRFCATLDDGTIEELVLPRPAPAATSKLDALRETVRAREAAVQAAQAGVPGLVLVRPKPWAIWAWPVRWIQLLFGRRKLAVLRLAEAELRFAQYELTTAEREIGDFEQSARGELGTWFDRLRVLSSGMRAGRGVRAIELEVASGPLEPGIEVVEVREPGAPDVDEVVTVTSDGVHVTTGDGSPRLVCPLNEAAAEALMQLPGEARACKLARRARESLVAIAAALDDKLERAENDFRNRIARLEMLRMKDEPDAFVRAQLSRIRGIVGSVHAVMEHASAHLGAELAQLGQQWTQSITAAHNADELKAAVAKLDEGWTENATRIGRETKLLVMGGIGGCAHDLLPELFAPLRQPGLPEPVIPRAAPALPAVEMLPALFHPAQSRLSNEITGAGPWIAGLFRSLEARRAEMLQLVTTRAAHVTEVAAAELLDAEPRLREALLETLGRELHAAVDKQRQWLASELEREHAAIAAERAALEPLVQVRDDARRDARELLELVSVRERELAIARTRSA